MRQIIRHIRVFLQTAFLLVPFTSCIDDTWSRVYGGPEICFLVHADTVPAQPQTRSVETAAPTGPPSGVIPMTNTGGGRKLYLHTFVSDNMENPFLEDTLPKTRGVPVTSLAAYDKFGILASRYSDEWDGTATPDYMYNVEVNPDGDYWKPAGNYYWPDRGQRLRFFAYAPYDGAGIELSPSTRPGTPSITYTVPGSAVTQSDLLVAVSDASGNPASLTFDHVLAGIRFVTGDDMPAGSITRITIKGVYGSGTYAMGDTVWNGLGNIKDFSQDLDKAFDKTPDVELTSQETTFMMIPQTLPENAQIEVTYTEAISKGTFTLTADIGGKEWVMGKLLTYRISTSAILSEGTFVVTEPAAFTYKGLSVNGLAVNKYYVTSYITTSRAGEAPVVSPAYYTIEFVEDDGNGGYNVIPKPSWLGTFSAGLVRNTSTGASSRTVSVNAQTLTDVPNRHDERLKSRNPVNGTYDLSTKGGAEPRTTANCYVVNAPGRYSFPLVYGNAVKNGADNPAAYTCEPGSERAGDLDGLYPDTGGKSVWVRFVNHLDRPIEDPYIYKNAGCNPSYARLLWQDGENLVTGVSLDVDKRNVTFDVTSADIRQGNAVLAVFDANDMILWSWHIWVTDYEPGLSPRMMAEHDIDDRQYDRNVTNAEGRTYTFMGVNLGWCDDRTRRYEKRSVKVRFTQAETALTRVITIRQLPKYLKWSNNLVYLHGNKNPLPAPYFTDNVPSAMGIKPCWPEEAFNGKGGETVNTMTLGETIRNPLFIDFKFNSTTRNWLTEAVPGNGGEECYVMNLWDADRKGYHTVKPVVKTIYDPCPRGYCVPSKDPFSGFLYQATYLSFTSNTNLSNINTPYKRMTEIEDSYGYMFYCNPMTGVGKHDGSGGLIFFPLSGKIDETNTASAIGKSSYYWTVISNDPTPYYHGTNMYSQEDAGSRSIYLQYNNGRGEIRLNLYSKCRDKAAIRPVREQ